MNDELQELIETFIKGVRELSDEPMDGDETGEIADRVLNELDYQEGNITETERKTGIRINREVT